MAAKLRRSHAWTRGDSITISRSLAHVYMRWQVKRLLTTETADVLQTAPRWTDGINELVKICAPASAFEVPPSGRVMGS